jgi:hypothetical protein
MVRIHPDPPVLAGAVAQLGEHLLCKQGVVGSIPSSSTSGWGRAKTIGKPCGLLLVFWISGWWFFNNAEEVKQLLLDGRGDGREPVLWVVG